MDILKLGTRTDKDTVILVHGIWMIGLEFVFLAHHLRKAGFDPHVFRYPSLRLTPAENAERLADFIDRTGAERVHLVAHSLGGIVVLHLIARRASLPPGRVVLIGSPASSGGSIVARRMAGSWLLRWLLGHSTEEGVLGGVPEWKGGRDLGVIAGDVPLGVGRLLGRLPGPSDGTVTVEETRVAGITDFVEIHGSHQGLLFLEETAGKVVGFLRHGHFGGRP